VTDATAPDGLEQVLDGLDTEAMDLIRRFYAVNQDTLVLRIGHDGTTRILYAMNTSAILEMVVSELPDMLRSCALALNDLAKAGRRH
jgi:hypothetical protein